MPEHNGLANAWTILFSAEAADVAVRQLAHPHEKAPVQEKRWGMIKRRMVQVFLQSLRRKKTILPLKRKEAVYFGCEIAYAWQNGFHKKKRK